MYSIGLLRNLKSTQAIDISSSSTTKKGREDIFRGITILSEYNRVSKDEAPEILQQSLKEWKEKNVHGIWFKVLKSDNFWISLLIEKGFDFHHAQPGYVMLTKWLPTHKVSSLPKYPFTSIGVGGIVCNSAADPSEEVYDTAKREVLEETGVETEFVTVFTMRHSTSVKTYKNVGDMYFVCAMKPLNEDKIEPKPCPRETSACAWMTREEIKALNDKDFHPFNRSILDAYYHWESTGRKGFHMSKFTISEFKRSFTVYNVD